MINTLKITSVFLDGIGEVFIKNSHKAKYLRININNNCEIKVVKPYFININDTFNFIYSKKTWIKKSKIKLSNKRIIRLGLPKAKLEQFWKHTEKRMLYFSKINGLNYQKLTFKTLKSRWGSCSFDNIICINNLVYYLPLHLKDYIMLHELMHTKIKNHQKEFWQELEKICQNCKIKRKELGDNYAIAYQR